MRRRKKAVQSIHGDAVPDDVADFIPAHWPGRSDYQKYVAWAEARQAWALENLPGGEDDLPPWDSAGIPDQPWDEVEL